MAVVLSGKNTQALPPSTVTYPKAPPGRKAPGGTGGGTTPTPSDNGSSSDPWGGLSGGDRDAYVAITEALKAYGLESLAPDVLGFIQNGYSADTINVLLQNTESYKKRFAANEVRRQKKLPVLSPAEYLATERAYRQVMSAAGLPVGFWDSPDDFEKFLGNDMSPAELQDRVKIAEEQIHTASPEAMAAWRQFYTDADAVAYALDPDRAVSVLDRQWRAAQVAGAGSQQGVTLDRSLAEEVANTGVDANAARQGMGAVAAVARNLGRLSQISQDTSYGTDDAVRDVFLNDQAAAEKRRVLASQERARFSGSSGVTQNSLSERKGGQV